MLKLAYSFFISSFPASDAADRDASQRKDRAFTIDGRKFEHNVHVFSNLNEGFILACRTVSFT
jgi:hypothetical protein